MSLSKAQPREPKCTRCRHHGIVVPQKGHMGHCPFLKCDCWRCFLVSERTRIRREQNREQRRSNNTAVGKVKQAAEGICSASVSDGGARQSAISGLTSGEAPGSAATSAASSRPAAGGGSSGKMLPLTASEEGSCTLFNAPHFGQTASLPLIHFPVRMSGHYPNSFALYPNFLLNMPWLPPVSAGLYNNGLCRPPIFPQSGAPRYPPPPQPGPPADCRQVFHTLQPPTLPEPFRVELTSVKHPQPPLSNTEDIIELE